MKRNKIWVPVFWVLTGLVAQAEPISLLQETHSTECRLVKHGMYERLWMDRKEYQLKLWTAKGEAKLFERVLFLDSAVLFKSVDRPESFALFQIHNNGEVHLTTGDRLEFFEKDCEDTGASKTCRTSEIKKFFWSSEKLSLQRLSESLEGPVSTYGALVNHGTYFESFGLGRKKDMALVLIDYGSKLHIVVGPGAVAQCQRGEAESLGK